MDILFSRVRISLKLKYSVLLMFKQNATFEHYPADFKKMALCFPFHFYKVQELLIFYLTSIKILSNLCNVYAYLADRKSVV